MATQALVIAHACYGHNSFFKGNHLFRQWTAADAILDYLVFARRYVMECEERHGAEAVEEMLDACHALMSHGVDRYRRPAPLSLKAEAARLAERESHRERTLQRPVAHGAGQRAGAARAAPQGSLSGGAAGEHPLLRRETLAEARALAARARAHRAQAGPVLLSAGPDQGHERGLGDVLALHDPQPAARAAAGRRRLHARIPEDPHQRRHPADVRLRRLRRAQSLRARVRDVRRPAPHLRVARRRGPRVVPGLRGQRLAAHARLRDAQLQGRIVHRPVPVAAADPRVPPVRGRRPPRRGDAARSTASTTIAVTAACAGCWRSSTRRSCACPTCRSSTTTATATAR